MQFALHDLATGQKRASFVGHTDFIYQLAVSPDGTQVASAAEDHTARLWDAASGTALHVLDGHTDKVLCGCLQTGWSAGCHIVGRRHCPPMGRCHRQAGRGPVPWPSPRGPDRLVQPGRALIASGGNDGSVQDLAGGGHRGHGGAPRPHGDCVPARLHPDGRRLASAADDLTARVWEHRCPARAGGAPRPHELRLPVVCSSPDGQLIRLGELGPYGPFVGRANRGARTTLDQRGPVRAPGLWPRQLVAGCGMRRRTAASGLDSRDGRRLKEIKGPGEVVHGARRQSGRDAGVAAAKQGGRIGVTDLASGKQLASWRVTDQWVEKKGLAYSPDGRWLACTGEDSKNIDIWDSQTLALVTRLAGHTAAVNSVAFSEDGSRMVSAEQ